MPDDDTFPAAWVDTLAQALHAVICRQANCRDLPSFHEPARAALAGLAAVDALVTPDHDRQVRAQALRDYADRHHGGVEGVSYPTDYGTGVEHDAVCGGCGASVDEDGCCSERTQLLADAAGFVAGAAPAGLLPPLPDSAYPPGSVPLEPLDTAGPGQQAWGAC